MRTQAIMQWDEHTFLEELIEQETHLDALPIVDYFTASLPRITAHLAVIKQMHCVLDTWQDAVPGFSAPYQRWYHNSRCFLTYQQCYLSALHDLLLPYEAETLAGTELCFQLLSSCLLQRDGASFTLLLQAMQQLHRTHDALWEDLRVKLVDDELGTLASIMRRGETCQ